MVAEKPEPKAPRKRTPTKRPTSDRQPADRAPKKPGPGKYSELSVTRCKNIIGAIQLGNYVKTACAYAGIGESTYYQWRKRGDVELDRVHSLPRKNLEDIMNQFDGEDPNDVDDRTGKPKRKDTPEYMFAHRPREFLATEWPYVVMVHLADRARASAEVRHVSAITQAAASGDWRAALAWLERSFPDRYGRVDRLQVSGDKQGDPIQHEIVTVDALTEKLRGLGVKDTAQ
jgi:hypothetical protein